MLFNGKTCNLQKRRVYKGWTQRELALKAGIGISQVRAYELNESTISYKTAKKLADLFGISIEQLYD
jgi:transcriptional regulator with XRE-family HTH domain